MGQKAKCSLRADDFRCSPNIGHYQDTSVCPFGANKRLMHRSNDQPYSITSSTRPSSGNGMVRPSAFAVLRFITSSNLTGCSIGKSAGFACR
jgi:hypothetical protein